VKVIIEIKKHNLLGIISLILAIIVIIIITIEFVIVVIWPAIPGDWNSILFIIFDVGNIFFVLLFLTIITTIVGIIAKVVKKDSFGMTAILIGILCFILNWILLFFCPSAIFNTMFFDVNF